MLSWPEVVVIGTVALVFFGPKRLPEMARSVGQGIKEFRKATQEGLQAFSEPEHSSPVMCSSCNHAVKDEEAQFCPQCGKALSPIPSTN